jgi:uncharacterized protein YndB with AHSA1/START domain
MASAARPVDAALHDVWKVLAEPYHLSDWWPGIVHVEPDVRGFAPGARWTVRLRKRHVLTGVREQQTTLVVDEIEPYEHWAWHLATPKLDVEIRLRADEGATLVSCVTSGRRPVAEAALRRLAELCALVARM